ncbi:MAG: histidine--tRNA ligase [Bacilli bacterium]|nr:histidine--tRNA ligase [Bacilli bacterium]
MLQKPKGTYDIYGDKSLERLYFKKLVEALMDKYNAKYFETPVFESSELFHRGVGETSDIVSKETYDFKDRGDRNLTLRPEGTAGIARCFIENKLYADALPLKAWYMGPMFRYERPQAGRYRQFYQFGFEAFGTYDPMMDAEVISIVTNLFKLLGLKGVCVNINTLGDSESRNNYRQALVDYFKPYLNDLCDDCQKRYEKNPLRILDCKIDGEKKIMQGAPKIIDYLNEESKIHFEKVKDYLDAMNIEYKVNPNIVRGLDYYTHTVFEVVASIKDFGSQNVLAGGGRYNNLVENIGGPSIPGVGFAVGLERLFLALEAEGIDIKQGCCPDVYIFATSFEQKPYVLSLANNLRMAGFNVEIDYDGKNFKNNFKRADKLNAKFIIIIGEEEVNTKLLTLKNNKTKEEYKVELDKIVEFLDEKMGDEHEN